MNIVIFNWAPIWKGTQLGGGVNGYLHALAPQLAARGHEVTAISAGLLHTQHPQDCFSRRHEDFQGVRVIEIINSPVLAPSAAQFREPMSEVSAPELEHELKRLLLLIKPDITHWHNVEGFSAGCIDVCRGMGAKVVYSLHNYHTLCSQVTLCKGHEKPCHNFESGHACSTCVTAPDPYSERLRRQNDFAPRNTRSHSFLKQEQTKALSQLKHELSWPKRVLVRGIELAKSSAALRHSERENASHPLPGRAVESPEDLVVKQIPVQIRLPVLGSQEIDEAYAEHAGLALSNEARRDPSSGQLLGPHARRRAAMVEMLNRCDRVLAVSEFVHKKYIAEGVDADRIQTQHIGTASAEQATPSTPRKVDSSVMRLVFLGFNHFNKGLPLLLTALQGMSGQKLRRIGLSIFAPGVQSIGPSFCKLHPPLAELNIRNGYKPEDLPRILGGHDLCYVGSAWWDPLPQTVLESLAFGVPVLGAQAGGIPDAVHEGENGFLFRANNPAALRQKLDDVLECFGTERWPSHIEKPKSISLHANEIEELYRSLVQHHEMQVESSGIESHHHSRKHEEFVSSSYTSRHMRVYSQVGNVSQTSEPVS